MQLGEGNEWLFYATMVAKSPDQQKDFDEKRVWLRQGRGFGWIVSFAEKEHCFSKIARGLPNSKEFDMFCPGGVGPLEEVS